jgi:ribonuclease BN (tRNA processing enzyme)
VRFEDLDAIILSHLHSDHTSDLMVLKYAVQIKNSRGTMNKLLNLYAPDSPEEEYNRLNAKDDFSLKQITEELVLNIGNLRITFRPMTHLSNPLLFQRITGKEAVYSGDTS